MTLDPRIVDAAAATVLESEDGYVNLASSAMSMRSVAMRDVMARVLGPFADFGALRAALRDGTVAPPKDATAAARWARFAMVVGYQQLEPDDADDAIAMFAVARTVLPAPQWKPEEARALVDVLWLAGRSGEIDQELLNHVEQDAPLERALLAIDLIGLSEGVGSARWIEMLNATLKGRGLAPIGLDNEGEDIFDHLSSTVEAGSVSGPLVSVVMSAYKPGPELLSAVGSILDQTWADFELLVVDDASGSEFDAILDQVAALDARVRVFRQPVNRGTYAARDRALAEAAGDFVTFQDSDDWSHPERIERQMRPLLENPFLLGTHSSCVRASPELVFQRLGYNAFRRLNASSHLFRRSVLDRLGGFDRVRKGADTEFHLRFEATFPGRSVRIWEPLAFVRLNDSSLSRSDFLPGWWRSDRAEYRDSMLHWHQAIESGADPFIGPGLAIWPLTAPRDFLRNSGLELTDPDVLVLADWTMDDSLHRAALDRILRRDTGPRIGLVQARSIRARNASKMDRSNHAVRQAIAAGEVDAVSLEEKLRVPRLVVLQPDVLQFPTSVPLGLSADQVEIVDDGGDGIHWARADVERVVGDWFGVQPTWREDPRPSIQEALLRTPRTRFRAQRPVIGWIAEPDGSDLPDSAAVVSQVYPAGEAMDVRLVGVNQPLSRRGIALGRSWLLYETEDVTARELWHQVDFAVAAPTDPKRNALEQTVGEALAAGCVVVLPDRFASWFGDAVVAAEPADMAAAVFRLRNDRTAYLEQVDRGRSWLAGSPLN